ncbi:MAG: hypothetical protein PHQ36_03730 [Anaerolineales bacterium]|nr:hypothetical protein [Anaerolineales bacterium]
MKPRAFFPTLILVALLSTSCAPQAKQPAANSTQAATQPAESVSQPQATQAPAVVPAVTSRGDKLQATDPATVNLASGGLQMVEFFRFT